VRLLRDEPVSWERASALARTTSGSRGSGGRSSGQGCSRRILGLSMRMRFTVISSVSRHVWGPLTRSPGRLRRLFCDDGMSRRRSGRHPKVDLLGGIFRGGALARRCHRFGDGRRAAPGPGGQQDSLAGPSRGAGQDRPALAPVRDRLPPLPGPAAGRPDDTFVPAGQRRRFHLACPPSGDAQARRPFIACSGEGNTTTGRWLELK